MFRYFTIGHVNTFFLDKGTKFQPRISPLADPGCPPQGGLINRDLEQMSKINDEITSGGANQ